MSDVMKILGAMDRREVDGYDVFRADEDEDDIVGARTKQTFAVLGDLAAQQAAAAKVWQDSQDKANAAKKSGWSTTRIAIVVGAGIAAIIAWPHLKKALR